jgi:F-type H+-transporting ATPase subunit delta
MARRTSAARRYAEAAFDLARRDDAVERWRTELDLASGVLSDERILRVLANPAVALEERSTLTDSILAPGGRSRVSQPVRNLIHLVLRRGRIEDLPRIAAEFRRLDDERQGITHAHAISAAPLTEDEQRAVSSRLQQTTGGRIELTVEVDPSLLGGLVVRVGDRLIDASVRGRLERLRSRLLAGAL